MRELVFRGIRPKYIPQKQDSGYGVAAINLDLYDGSLRGFNAPAPVGVVHNPDGTRLTVAAHTLYKAGATWVGFPEHTWIIHDVVGDPTFAQFIYVKDGKLHWQSEQRMLEGCAPVVMGTPMPCLAPPAVVLPNMAAQEPSITMSCVDNPTVGPAPCVNPDVPELRGYRCTYVKQYPCCTGRQEESAPGPATYVEVRKGDAIYLDKPEALPAGVTAVRWWRAVPGTKGGVVWLLVGESDGTPLLDDKRAMGLGAPLETTFHYPPPDCPLEGVALLGDARILVWQGTHFWTSHPHAPHAFDVDQCTYAIPFPIVAALGVTAATEAGETFETHLLTTGKPYGVTSNTKAMHVEIREVQAWHPCLSVHSVCDMRGSTGYVSPYGFVRFTGTGVENLTDAWFTEHEWGQYLLHEMRVTLWHERLWFGVPRLRDGFVLSIAPDDGARPRTLVQHTISVTAWHARADTGLHLTGASAALLEWDRGLPLRWTWESDRKVRAELWHPTAFKVVSGDGWHWRDQDEAWLEYQAFHRARPNALMGEFFTANPQHRHLAAQFMGYQCHIFTLLRNGTAVFERPVASPRPVRTPRLARANEWSYRISGYQPVREVHVQTGMMDLTEDGGS